MVDEAQSLPVEAESFDVAVRGLVLNFVPQSVFGVKEMARAVGSHLVRYVGWYSNQARGERAKQGLQESAVPSGALPTATEPAPRAGATWAKLIRKYYEADKCQATMRVIALIDEPQAVRRILEHLERWAPLPAQSGPPAPDPDWPPGATIPLTYHLIPDIA